MRGFYKSSITKAHTRIYQKSSRFVVILLILTLFFFSMQPSPKLIGTFGQEFGDIENKVKLNKIGGYNYSLDSSLDVPEFMQFNDPYLYIAAKSNGFMIFDLTNPVYPQLLGSFDTGRDIQHFVIDGDIVYLADSRYGVRILDISNKQNPINISQIYLREDVSFRISEVQLLGNLLFVGRPSISGLLTILDVSNPLVPKIVFNPEFGYIYSSFAVSDDTLILTNSDSGIRIYNINDLNDIIFLRNFDPLPEGGSIFSEQYTFQVYLRDKVAILNDYQAGISTVNITDNTIPIVMDREDPGDGWIDDLQLADNYGIAISNTWDYSFLQIYEIGDLSNLEIIYQYNYTKRLKAVAMNQQYVFLIDFYYETEDNITTKNKQFQLGIYEFTEIDPSQNNGGNSDREDSDLIFSGFILGFFVLSIIFRRRGHILR